MKTKEQIKAALRTKRLEIATLQEELQSLKNEVQEVEERCPKLQGKSLKAFREVLDETTIENPSKLITKTVDKHLAKLVDYATNMETYINKLAVNSDKALEQLNKY